MGNKIQADFGSVQEINIGIKEKDRKLVCKGLSKILADSYLLYLKTQNYYWNVTGPQFKPLRDLFEEQYKELTGPLDGLAERIRALGEFAPGSFTSYAKISTIKEENGIPTAVDMIQNLLQDNETIISGGRELVSLADESEDDVTASLLVQRMQSHEKNAWILRSLMPARHTH